MTIQHTKQSKHENPFKRTTQSIQTKQAMPAINPELSRDMFLQGYITFADAVELYPILRVSTIRHWCLTARVRSRRVGLRWFVHHGDLRTFAGIAKGRE